MLAAYEEARLRKRLLSILRQKADHLLLYYDTYGFTPVNRLIEYLRTLKDFPTVRREDLAQVVEHDVLGEFEWDGGALIRATFGFSPSRAHRGTPMTPPEELYYGTHRKLLAQTEAAGLIPIASDVVQLATEPSNIGEAGDTLFLVKVKARAAAHSGVIFYQASERFFFCEELAPQFLQI